MNQNDSIIVETLLFGLNGLNQWRKECMDNRINNRIYYNHGKVHNTIVMNPFKEITTFLEIYVYIMFLMPCWKFIIKVTLYVIFFS